MRQRSLLIVFIVAGSLAVGAPSAAGGGCHGGGDSTSSRGSDGATLEIVACTFTPSVVFIEPGDELRWSNRDPVPHTVSGIGLSWGSHDNIADGDSVTYHFKSEGVYPYYCLLHPSMVGAVVVGDPAAAKSAAEPMKVDVEMAVDSDAGGADIGGKTGASIAAATAERQAWTWVPFAMLALAAAGGSLVVRRMWGRRVSTNL
jgi:plastocyanin